MSNRHQAKHNTTRSGSTRTKKNASELHQQKVADQSTGEMNPHHVMSTNQNVNTDYLHPPLDKGWGKELPHDHWSSAPDLGGHYG